MEEETGITDSQDKEKPKIQEQERTIPLIPDNKPKTEPKKILILFVSLHIRFKKCIILMIKASLILGLCEELK